MSTYQSVNTLVPAKVVPNQSGFALFLSRHIQAVSHEHFIQYFGWEIIDINEARDLRVHEFALGVSEDAS